jgi:hypothetical protein
MNEDFYIGWADRAPAATARVIRRTALLLLFGVVVIACLIAWSQRTIGVAVYEWGTKKQFTGIFRAWPYPHLLLPRPAGIGEPETFSTYFLVAPWKFGLDHDAVAKFDGKVVSLRGTLIYRDAQTMIEVNSADITESPEPKRSFTLPQTISLGQQTLAGEIVDSKCFFGVMDPGQLAPHRACATLCISGGIPPVLVVWQKNGQPLYLLLASKDGKPLNRQVLDFVALPVRATGEVKMQDGLLVLCADPADIVRL